MPNFLNKIKLLEIDFAFQPETEKAVKMPSARGSFLVASLAKIALLIIFIRYANGPLMVNGVGIRERSVALPPLPSLPEVPDILAPNSAPAIESANIAQGNFNGG